MGMVINTPPDNVAFSIALGVLLLSVVLHPIVRACFHRIRADRAWRAIEKQAPVEVTKYNIFSEALGDRGKWDTARVVTFMLAAFHVSTWGLELSLDLALRTDGPVDLLNRPPPVVFRQELTDPAHDLTDWIVSERQQAIDAGGSLGNFHGTLDDGNATASYRIDDSIVHGNTLFASWSPESARISSGLFYDVADGEAEVDGMVCSVPSRSGAVFVGSLDGASSRWGVATECESGPKLLSTGTAARASPPTILLNSSEGLVHMIVEEESSYPSFLYSVWRPREVTAEGALLTHVFYISSTTRLAEAIVSGIANDVTSGGGCVDFLAAFSLENVTYELNGARRVSPFGEHPRSSSVERLDQVEPIVAGVLVSDVGTVCGVLLLVVTGSAFVGCLFFHSRKSLDVYNRDELIRAISLPSGGGGKGDPVALKIYVRQEENKPFSIVISDDGVYRGFNGLRKRVLALVSRPSAATGSSSGSLDGSMSRSRSGSLPPRSREITFEGVRPAFDEDQPVMDERCRIPTVDRARVAHHTPSQAHRVPMVMELTASPVPASLRSREITFEGVRPAFDEDQPVMDERCRTPTVDRARVAHHTPSQAHRMPMVMELTASPVPASGGNASRGLALMRLDEVSPSTSVCSNSRGGVRLSRAETPDVRARSNMKEALSPVDVESPAPAAE